MPSKHVRFTYEQVPVEQINPLPDNPRRTDGRMLDHLERSMQTYGITVPLVFNRQTGNLVSGHQRYRVLLKQRVETVYCAVIDVDQSTERGLAVALNHLKGRWDDDKLAEVLAEIEGDVDLFVAGFNSAEVDYILGRTRRQDSRNAPESDFLDQFLTGDGTDEDTPVPAPDAGPASPGSEHPGAAAPNPDLTDPSLGYADADLGPVEEHTILFLDMPVTYRDRVFEAMAEAGQLYGARNSLEELVALCQAFLDHGPYATAVEEEA